MLTENVEAEQVSQQRNVVGTTSEEASDAFCHARDRENDRWK
jgi:hypothetical protein